MPVGDLGPYEVVTTDADSTVGDVALAVTGNDDVASLPVEEVMAADPATLHEDDDAMEVSRGIDRQNVRRFPVVDDGRVAGIVTLDDLVATIGEQLDNVADTIEAQSPDYRP